MGQTPLTAYSAPPDPLAGFKGPTSKGRREGRGRKGGEEGKEGIRKKGEGGERGGEGKGGSYGRESLGGEGRKKSGREKGRGWKI